MRYHWEVIDASPLRELHLELALDDERRSQFVALARRIQGLRRKVLALHPLSESIGVLSAGVHLGLALGEVSSGTVAMVDANHRWPAVIPTDDEEARSDEDERVFATRWIRGSLALLLPRVPGAAGAGVPALEQLLRSGGELFAHVLVDLTGFKRLGELPAALKLCDGVIAVARAGETTEDELLRMGHELPPEKNLGVLVTGRER